MSEVSLSPAEIETLFSPSTIRKKAEEVHKWIQDGKGYFQFHEDKLNPTVEYVVTVMYKKYPQGPIPAHSRRGHFRAGEVDRVSEFHGKFKSDDRIERARAELDLVITSVLLDAGAGSGWTYREEASGKSFVRSEGLAVASYQMFISGAMAADKKSLKADAEALLAITPDILTKHFQVSSKNPLVGVAGRAQLLNGLGTALSDKARFRDGRPGNILDYLIEKHGKQIPAPAILRAVIDGFGAIWPGRLMANGVNLGDVWQHSQLGFIPFHKLSQWMTYSLIEPITDAGFEVTDIDQLTGLPEYRNGGLILDAGLISLRDPALASQSWKPESDLVIEWRALTVYSLDRIADAVREKLGKTKEQFPLAKVLEGGTWWAGRMIAKEKRPGGEPPIQIESDGTVF